MKQDPLQTVADALTNCADPDEIAGVFIIKPLANPSNRKILVVSDNGLAWLVSVDPLSVAT